MNAKTLKVELDKSIRSRIVPIDASSGKTILSVYQESNNLCIKYTDGTFSYVSSELFGYGRTSDAQLKIYTDDSDFEDWTLYIFAEAGIILDSEHKEYQDLDRLERNKDRLDKERQSYLQLKAKFEPNN